MTPTAPVFDVRTYVEEFEDAIVPAYLRGRADAEWPADVGLARSIIPPGTAAARDFSHLAPRLPQFVAERCVGCMACVSACPDSALIARVVPEADVAPAVGPLHRGESRRRRDRGGPSGTVRPDEEVRRGPGAKRHPAWCLRPVRRAHALQGMRRVCRGVRRPRARRLVHDGQGRGRPGPVHRRSTGPRR